MLMIPDTRRFAMNEWEDNKQEYESGSALPINGSDAVREAMDSREKEAAERLAEEERQREAAAAEARRLAEEHRQAVLAEQEDRKRRWEDYNRQKEAAEKARRKMKRRSFVSVVAALVAIAALAFGVTNYLQVRDIKTQMASLESQVAAASAAAVPGRNHSSSITNPGVLTDNAALATVAARNGAESSLTDVSGIVSEVIPSVVSMNL